MSEWVTDTYKIVVRKEVWGLVWRSFGVRYDLDIGEYALTHVPTGRQLATAETEEAVKRIAGRLEKIPLDWGNEDPQYFEQAYRDHKAEIRRVLGISKK